MQFFADFYRFAAIQPRLTMFVCVFAKKFPALASQSCCEVSRPMAVGEYEYRLLVRFDPFIVTVKQSSIVSQIVISPVVLS